MTDSAHETLVRGFVLHWDDNVATLLDAAVPGVVTLLGEATDTVQVAESVAADHKIAIAAIPAGEPVIKNGVTIGVASRSIEAGQWVHLHNCRSVYDERSQTLDLHSGAAGDVSYD